MFFRDHKTKNIIKTSDTTKNLIIYYYSDTEKIVSIKDFSSELEPRMKIGTNSIFYFKDVA